MAGISISLVLGENGIITRAREGRVRTLEEQIKERIQLAYHSALTGGQGNYTKESLETELEKEFGEDFEEVDDSNETNWKLKAQGQEITIPAGKKETNPSGKLSEEQLRMKITNETGDCMIDEKGNIIPIDAWVYDKYDENMTAILHGTSYYDDWDSEWVFQTNAYKKSIVDGKLEYEIPVFIKLSSNTYKVTELGADALRGIRLESISIPSSIIKLGNRSFQYAEILNVTVPNSVKTIGSEAFYNFKGNVELNQGTEKIEGRCFYGSTITSIIIPSSIDFIGWEAFVNCNHLTSVDFKVTEGWKYKYMDAAIYKYGERSFSNNPSENVEYLVNVSREYRKTEETEW